MSKHALLLSAVPVSAAMCRYAQPEDFVVACDAGYRNAERLDLRLDLIVGDFDSAPQPKTAHETIVLPHVKDDTDTQYAARWLLEHGYDQITMPVSYTHLDVYKRQTLERLPLLDYILNQFTKKPVAKLDAPVRAVLRAGLAQARYMNVPLPAAVDESVKLTRNLGKSSAAGMVNAVLRRAAVANVQESDFADPLDRLSIYYCLSRPVAELFYAQFGAEAFPLAAAFYEKPQTAIRVNTLRTSDAALTALLQHEGHTVTPGPWLGALLVDFVGSPAASEAFQKGLFHVQGLASQFTALCVDAQPGQQVLDLCAAPGGKSLTLAEAMQDKGQLVSGEFVPSRVPLLQRSFDRCGVTCAVAVENDATKHNSEWPKFDRVLCDVPCSGLGVIAKKPDIRYKDLDGIENLLAAQQKILQNGADSLAENGRLVYSCLLYTSRCV